MILFRIFMLKIAPLFLHNLFKHGLNDLLHANPNQEGKIENLKNCLSRADVLNRKTKYPLKSTNFLSLAPLSDRNKQTNKQYTKTNHD